MAEMGGLDFHLEEEEDQLPPPRRLLRAECILAQRTSRFILVMETLTDANNYQALLRTAESFGVQNVWIVETGKKLKHEEKIQLDQEPIGDTTITNTAAPSSSITATPTPSAALSSALSHHEIAGAISMSSGRWLTLRHFASTTECIAALRAEGREIWVTTLTPTAQPLDAKSCAPLPDRFAIVLGRELDGVSQEMIRASTRQVFLPMYGFTESFNVAAAGALVLQRLFDLAPDARGQMSVEERNQIRERWYKILSRATPGSEADYMQHWLPRSARTIELMHATIEVHGLNSLLRPLEETRTPHVMPKVRKRMIQEGQRSVNILTDSQPKKELEP